MIKSIEIRENGIVITLLGGPREFDIRVRWEDEPVKETEEKDKTEAAPTLNSTFIQSERNPTVEYEVLWDIHGVHSCTCPSFVYRGPCKHFLDPRVVMGIEILRRERVTHEC